MSNLQGLGCLSRRSGHGLGSDAFNCGDATNLDQEAIFPPPAKESDTAQARSSGHEAAHPCKISQAFYQKRAAFEGHFVVLPRISGGRDGFICRICASLPCHCLFDGRYWPLQVFLLCFAKSQRPTRRPLIFALSCACLVTIAGCGEGPRRDFDNVAA